MTGLSHAMISWGISQAGGEEIRDRRLIAWLGILPDLDSISYIFGWLKSRDESEAFYLFSQIHHRYTHGIGFVFLACVLGGVFGRKKIMAATLCGVSAVVHMLCDLVGSGPDWPIYPLWPFSDMPLAWTWSIPVQDMPNILAGFFLTVGAFWWGIRRGRTPFEMLSVRMDSEFLAALKKRTAAKACAVEVDEQD